MLSLLYDALEKRGLQVSSFSPRKLLFQHWDVWHLHWPQDIVSGKGTGSAIVRLVKFWLALKLARFKKVKIFWTVHNLRPHERDHPLLERVYWHIFLPNVDGIICMSDAGRELLIAEQPRAKSIRMFTVPHGHYKGAYPDAMSKDQARRALGLSPDSFVVTYIGQIRPYKGVSRLIRRFVEANMEDAQLLVAGRPANEAIKGEIEQAAGRGSNVSLFLDFVEKNDLQKYLRAADLVALPYTEILNSGSSILALSFDRPVLAPNRGALAELRNIVGPDWVRLYNGELSSETIRSAVQWTKMRQITPNAIVPLEALDWNSIAEMMVRTFSFDL